MEILKFYQQWINKKQIGHFETEIRQKFPQLFKDLTNWRVPQTLSTHLTNPDELTDSRIHMFYGTSKITKVGPGSSEGECPPTNAAI